MPQSRLTITGKPGRLRFEDDVGEGVEVGEMHEDIVLRVEPGDIADEAGNTRVPGVALAK